jgi:hypothetical protein
MGREGRDLGKGVSKGFSKGVSLCDRVRLIHQEFENGYRYRKVV